MPLLFGCDFWINLAVCMDDPILGLDGALANASIWNVSNQWRFLLEPSTASVAVAEILAIPEVNERLIVSILSLESYQFIGGLILMRFILEAFLFYGCQMIQLLSIDIALI